MTYVRLTILGTLSALALSGCAAPGSPDTAPPPSASSTTVDEHQDDHHDHTHVPLPAVTAGWSAEKVAVKVLRAWSRHDLTSADWWAGLSPMLAPAAQQNYAYTDPQNVPLVEISGPPLVRRVSRGAAAVASVEVPTSLGVFTVELTRQAAVTGWLMWEISFPRGFDDLVDQEPS